MEKRLFPLILIAIGVLFFLMAGTLTATSKRKDAPDVIELDDKGFKKDRYGPVKFNHAKHQDEYKNPEGKPIPCQECHHVYENGKNVWKDDDKVQKCVECHDPEKTNAKNKNQKKLQLAFHSDCKDCHEAVVKAGIVEEDKAPFKKCIQCMGKKK